MEKHDSLHNDTEFTPESSTKKSFMTKFDHFCEFKIGSITESLREVEEVDL